MSANQVTYSREDVLAAVFQDEDSEFEEDSSDEDSDLEEESNVLSGSGEEFENSSEGPNNDTPCGQAAGSRRQRVRNRTIFRLNWEVYECLDQFESNWLPKYQRPRGILVHTNDFEPVNYFTLFFPSEAFDLMSEETNRYAMQYLDTTVDFSSRFSL